jgi:protein phosphatase-4 regulatory subunit 3
LQVGRLTLIIAAALKYFRTVVGLHDEQHNRQMIAHQLFEPIVKVLFETMPRDNLLNSACLELFEFIKRDNVKALIQHVVETYREKLEPITYVDTFQNLILRYDQMNEPVTTQELDHSFTSVDSDNTGRHMNMVNGGRWGQALKDPDPEEEAYFNGSDDEEDDGFPSAEKAINGASPVRPLVNYPDDDEEALEDDIDILASSAPSATPRTLTTGTQTQTSPTTPKSAAGSPPERLSEKRRREEDEEDELLASISSSGSKRRASLTSNSSTGSLRSLRRKSPNIASKDSGGGTPKKISISIPLKTGGERNESE